MWCNECGQEVEKKAGGPRDFPRPQVSFPDQGCSECEQVREELGDEDAACGEHLEEARAAWNRKVGTSPRRNDDPEYWDYRRDVEGDR